MSENSNGSQRERIVNEEEVIEDTTDIAIDVDTGERISPESLGGAGFTVEEIDKVIELGAEEGANDPEPSLSTNQILMAILDALNTRNKLAQETNKRLRDQNKILRRMAGLTGPSDKTVQGTPPNVKSTGFPE